MTWIVDLSDEVEAWYDDLAETDPDSRDLVAAALDLLEDAGPTLGRPLVDRIQHSTLHNLKELRPGSKGRSEIRILFVFDPERRAVMLVAGDKSGDWDRWYKRNVPIAEQRYERHLAKMKEEQDG